MWTVTIDPGLNECGIALWRDDRLVDAELLQTRTKPTDPVDDRIMGMARELEGALLGLYEHNGEEIHPLHIVVERMEPRKRLEAAWSSLIDLALISGVVLGIPEATAKFLRPSEWTGGRAKAVNHPRILKRLSPEERDVLERAKASCPAKNHKELLDAVGIGLYTHMRL